jgi:hypothetical protein
MNEEKKKEVLYLNTWIYSPESNLIHSALLILILFQLNWSSIIHSFQSQWFRKSLLFLFFTVLFSLLLIFLLSFHSSIFSTFTFYSLNPNVLACKSLRPGSWRATACPNLEATEDHYVGGLRKRGPLGCPNIPLSRKEHATVFLFLDRRKAIVKGAINHFSHNNIFNLNYLIYCVS